MSLHCSLLGRLPRSSRRFASLQLLLEDWHGLCALFERRKSAVHRRSSDARVLQLSYHVTGPCFARVRRFRRQVFLVRLFPSSLSNSACGLRSPSVAPLGRCPLTFLSKYCTDVVRSARDLISWANYSSTRRAAKPRPRSLQLVFSCRLLVNHVKQPRRQQAPEKAALAALPRRIRSMDLR